MTIETIKALLAYNKWANEQVLNCVKSAPADVFKAEHDYSVGSLHQQVFHVMQSDWWAITSLTEGDMSQSPKIEDYDDFDSIMSKWQEIDAQYDEYIESLESLDGSVTIQMQTPFEMPLFDFLMSGINHGTNHRAQILALLHKHGQETCEQGYFFYTLAREKAATA